MQKLIKGLEFGIYWLIILLPFSMAISPAPMNIFSGLLIFLFLVKNILKKQALFLKNRVNFLLWLLFFITCLSLVNSINLKDTLRGGILRLLQYIFITFAIAQDIRDTRHIRRIIFSISAGLLLVSFDAFWQVASGKDFIRSYAPIINIGLIRATASFKDANTFGIYLSVFSPLIFGITFFSSTGKKRLVMLLVSIITLIAILLTYSRPTLLAIYLSLLFLALARKNKFLISLLLILLLISPFVLPSSVKEYARKVNYNPLRFMCNDDRIAIFRNSFNMIRQHPVIGVGANTFMKNYKHYKDFPEYRNVVTAENLYAHNIFLHLTAEIGLLGLLIFICLIYAIFKNTALIYKKLQEKHLRVIALALSACLMAFLINGLTESSLYSSRVAISFWYLLGFTLSLNKFIPTPQNPVDF